jgi:hypothetical protein
MRLGGCLNRSSAAGPSLAVLAVGRVPLAQSAGDAVLAAGLPARAPPVVPRRPSSRLDAHAGHPQARPVSRSLRVSSSTRPKYLPGSRASLACSRTPITHHHHHPPVKRGLPWPATACCTLQSCWVRESQHKISRFSFQAVSFLSFSSKHLNPKELFIVASVFFC